MNLQRLRLIGLLLAVAIVATGCEDLAAVFRDLGEQLHSIVDIADKVHVDPALVRAAVPTVAAQAKAREAGLEAAFSEPDREAIEAIACEVLEYEVANQQEPDGAGLQAFVASKLEAPPQRAAQDLLDFATDIKADNPGQAAFVAAVSTICGFSS